MAQSLNITTGLFHQESDYIVMKKLSFILFDLNGDEQICEIDEIAFDFIYMHGG